MVPHSCDRSRWIWQIWYQALLQHFINAWWKYVYWLKQEKYVEVNWIMSVDERKWLRTGAVGSIAACWSRFSTSVDPSFSLFHNFSVSDKFFIFPSQLKLNSFFMDQAVVAGQNDSSATLYWEHIPTLEYISNVWGCMKLDQDFPHSMIYIWALEPGILRWSRLRLTLLWNICSISDLETFALCPFSISNAVLVAWVRSSFLWYSTGRYAPAGRPEVMWLRSLSS